MKKIIFLFLILFLTLGNVEAYYEAPVQIIDMDIESIQKSVDEGLLTYELITKLYLDRIEAYDNKFNSIISINDQAIEQAKQLDIDFQKNGRKSMLYGIPIIIKDNIDYTLLPTTAGSYALNGSYPLKNSLVVDKLLDAGAIILAKANMSEFAFMASSSISDYGSVKNPYNTAYTPYGSSGGTATAVSLQFAPVGLGTDTNSSIRLPASATSLLGLRPTYGLISNNGVLPYDYTRDTIGPLTRNTMDSIILMNELVDNYLSLNNIKNYDIKNLKIGVLRQSIENNMYSELSDLIKQTINKLETNGAKIVYIDDFYNNTTEEYYDDTIGGWGFCNEFNKYISGTTSNIKSFYDLSKQDGIIYEYVEDCGSKTDNLLERYKPIKTAYQNYVDTIMKNNNVDLLMYAGTKNKIPLNSNIKITNYSYKISSPTGYPALNIPIGFDTDSLPYGIEVLSQNEEILYKLAYQLEKIQNHYKLSSLTPSLYETYPSVLNLIKKIKEPIEKNLYTEKSVQIYQETIDKTKKFFINYNDYENKELEAQKLIADLENSRENLQPNLLSIKSIKNPYFNILIILIIIILFIIIMKKKKKTKKVLKKKHKLY